MAPVGMYPHNAAEIILNLPALEGTIRRWWYFCQWMIVPYMAESKLIQNNWSTIKYKKSKEGIICEDYSNMAWNITKESRILDTTAIVHGCKDGSLATLFSATPRDLTLLAKRKKKYAALRKAKAETEINA
jgi:hypothetical protein